MPIGGCIIPIGDGRMAVIAAMAPRGGCPIVLILELLVALVAAIDMDNMAGAAVAAGLGASCGADCERCGASMPRPNGSPANSCL